MSLLIVDGYNIINNWPDFETLRLSSMEVARVKLVEILEEFAPLLWEKIIVVFDAYQVRGGIASSELSGDVEVIYTAEGQSADVFIERLVVELSAVGEKVEVASSDHLEQRLVLWKGGRRLSARELRERVQEAKAALQKQYIGARFGNVLDERLSERVRAILEKWRRTK